MSDDELPVGTVAALYRYPVKSTAGQSLRASAVTAEGLLHDRRWAAYTDDGGIASGKRTRRFRPVIGLMRWTSTIEDGCDISEPHVHEPHAPQLLSPDGSTYWVDDPAASAALTAAFGRRLTLREEGAVRHHDDSPVHVVTTSSLAAIGELVGSVVDQRRFRPNVVIDTGPESRFLENGWVGAELTVGGEVVLRMGPGVPRCVMIDQAQAGVTAIPKALQTIGARNALKFGLYARPSRSGTVRVGDVVSLRRPAVR